MDFDAQIKEMTQDNSVEEVLTDKELVEKVGQNQIYDIILSRKPDWQSIIYDLIHTEQLDPWDVDLVILTNKYFERLHEIEEADFYVSSKVLFAAALLLRIKSEFLLNKHLKSIDAILFGKPAEEKYVVERIEIDENELPILIPKTPLPRSRRVTLPELLTALGKAINTESRRIKREVAVKRAEKLSEVDFPKFRKIDLKDRIKQFYAKVLTSIRKKGTNPEKHLNKIGFTELSGNERDEKLACFLPVLHLSNNQRLWLEQDGHLEEIWVYLYQYFKKNKDQFIEELEEDIESMKQELGQATGKEITKNEEESMAKEIASELIEDLDKEIKDVEKEEKIDELTGFSNEQ
ncbi:segregation/condensation protein A [Candidatus Pacearchaeota archaeon]|nr:segregation/condensation protein A [Candidatus Pacearchaeota archaeon]